MNDDFPSVGPDDTLPEQYERALKAFQDAPSYYSAQQLQSLRTMMDLKAQQYRNTFKLVRGGVSS